MKVNSQDLKNIAIIILIAVVIICFFKISNSIKNINKYKNIISQLDTKIESLNNNYESLEKEKDNLIKKHTQLINKINSMDRESYLKYLKENYK